MSFTTFCDLEFNKFGYYNGQPVITIGGGDPYYRRANGVPDKGTRGIVKYETGDCLRINWRIGSDMQGIYVERTYLQYIKPIEQEPTMFLGQIVCDHCGSIEDAETCTYIPGLGYVCRECLERDFFQCDECGSWEANRCATEVYRGDAVSERICRACSKNDEKFGYCGVCNRINAIDDLHVSSNGAWFCDACADEFTDCPECGRADVRRDDFVRFTWLDHDVCPNCAERKRRDAINNYSYKPVPKYKTKHKSDQIETDASIHDLLFGVELEIDNGEDPILCAMELKQVTDDIYCKHDGSLHDAGIEIVSHPCTLYYHTHELGWDKLISVARKYMYESHNAKTCGLHVHIGRRQLENGDLDKDVNAAKLVMAVNRHWENLVNFSRRYEGQLERWANRNSFTTRVYSEEALIESALDTRDDGRYQAVNLCNDYTVEIRIFRGTLELNTLYATLQLVSNFCRYVQKHSVLEVMNSQWEDIACFEEYPELTAYLEKRDLINVPDLPAYSYEVPAWTFNEEAESNHVIFPVYGPEEMLTF